MHVIVATCVLTRNQLLSRDSLMLAMRIVFSCPCKVRSRVSDALSQALCNLPLAFLADFTLSDSTAPIRFIVKLFSLANYTLLFVWIERQYHRVHTSVLQVQQLYTLHCGHTFVGRHTYCQWPIIELANNVSSSPKNKMSASHGFIRMRVFRGVKNCRPIL